MSPAHHLIDLSARDGGDLRSAPGANRSGPVRHSCPSFQAGRRAALNSLPASEFNAAEGGLRPHGGNYHLTSTVHKGGHRTVLNLRAVRLLSSAYTILCAVTMKEAIFKNSRVYCKFLQHVSDQELFLKRLQQSLHSSRTGVSSSLVMIRECCLHLPDSVCLISLLVV